MTDSQREFYSQCVKNGCTPMLAEMLALKQPPGLKTDTTYLKKANSIASVVNNGSYNDKVLMRRTIEAAARRGFRPNKHDVYEPQLAAFPGDPRAFISSDSPRHQIQQLCEERGLECNGAVNVKGRPPEEDPLGAKKGLAEDLLREKMLGELKNRPDIKRMKPKVRRKTVRNMREKLVDKHGS